MNPKDLIKLGRRFDTKDKPSNIALTSLSIRGQFWARDNEGQLFSVNLKDVTEIYLTHEERDQIDAELGYYPGLE